MSIEYDKTMATQAQAAQETVQSPAKRKGLLVRLSGWVKTEPVEGRATRTVAA